MDVRHPQKFKDCYEPYGDGRNSVLAVEAQGETRNALRYQKREGTSTFKSEPLALSICFGIFLLDRIGG
jgi:hypothetical protein